MLDAKIWSSDTSLGCFLKRVNPVRYVGATCAGGASGRWRVLLVALLLSVVLLPASALAQLYAGSLQGDVKDSTGALVPGATLTLTDVGKGFVHSTKSDNTGHYAFRNLEPTVYKLEVVQTGFQSELIPTITITVNEAATNNITLKVGQGNEVVDVSSTPGETINTENGETGQLVDRNLISNLPLINRAVFDLAYLAPGVSPPAGGTFGNGSQANNFVSEGSRNAQADILIDGVTTTNYDQNTGFVDPLYTPSVDAVQEFKIQQTNFSAEFGFSGATIVNVITRDGSNTIHGSVYEYLRNTVLNGENYFQKNATVPGPNPPYHKNDFGGTIGGPIIKDKLFYFFDFEGVRQITPQTDTLDLPTAAERTGDFSQLCSTLGGSFNGAGQCSAANGQLWDPYAFSLGAANQHTSTSFIPFNNLATYASHGSYFGVNGLVSQSGQPGNLLSPVSQAILKYIPLPNNGTSLHGNYVKTGGNVTNSNQYDAKLSYQPGANDNLTGRFSYAFGNSEDANLFGNPFDANTQGPTVDRTYQGAINYTHTFNSKSLLTASLGLTHAYANTAGVAFNSTQVGIPNDVATNPVKGIQQAVAIGISGYAGENSNANFGGQPYAVLSYAQDVGQFISTYDRIIGHHDIKVGGEIRLHRINFTQFGITSGLWSFNGSSTAQDANNGASGGDSMASFLTGFGAGWDADAAPAQPATQNWQYAMFVQDNWRVTPKLTMNLGFRYDLDMPRTERHDRMSYFDPSIASPYASQVQGVDPSVCPACDNLRGAFEYVGGSNSRYPYNVYYGAVGPRLGFAYALKPATSIRGGFGIYYDPGKTGAAGTGSGAGGFQGYATQTNWAAYGSNAATNYNAIIPNYQGILGQDPGGPPAPFGKTQGLATALGTALQNIPVRTFNQLPREYSWSLGIEHQFGPKLLVDIDYIGKHGQNLYLGGFQNYLEHISPATAAAYRTNPGSYTQSVNPPLPVCAAVAVATNDTSYANPVGQTYTANSSGQVTSCTGSYPRYNLFMPYPLYAIGAYGDAGVQNVDPPIARSNYHALTARVVRPMTRGLQLLLTYTAQQSFDNGSSQGTNFYITPENNSGVQDPNDTNAEYALSSYSVGQIAQATAVWSIPYGKGFAHDSHNMLINGVLGNWNVNGTYRWDSGQPIEVPLGSGGQATIVGYNSRPNLNGQLKKSAGVQGIELNGVVTGNYFQNPGVFTRPADYADGTSPRTLQGVAAPGTNNFDLSVNKNFPFEFVHEGFTLRARWEAFNVFNHVQYAAPGGVSGLGGVAAGAGPISTLNGNTFGVITSQANAPFTQQVSLQLSF